MRLPRPTTVVHCGAYIQITEESNSESIWSMLKTRQVKTNLSDRIFATAKSLGI